MSADNDHDILLRIEATLETYIKEHVKDQAIQDEMRKDLKTVSTEVAQIISQQLNSRLSKVEKEQVGDSHSLDTINEKLDALAKHIDHIEERVDTLYKYLWGVAGIVAFVGFIAGIFNAVVGWFDL
jgi:ribosome-binding ATPase YchF (GTP1/OBG family)